MSVGDAGSSSAGRLTFIERVHVPVAGLFVVGMLPHDRACAADSGSSPDGTLRFKGSLSEVLGAVFASNDNVEEHENTLPASSTRKGTQQVTPTHSRRSPQGRYFGSSGNYPPLEAKLSPEESRTYPSRHSHVTGNFSPRENTGSSANSSPKPPATARTISIPMQHSLYLPALPFISSVPVPHSLRPPSAAHTSSGGLSGHRTASHRATEQERQEELHHHHHGEGGELSHQGQTQHEASHAQTRLGEVVVSREEDVQLSVQASHHQFCSATPAAPLLGGAVMRSDAGEEQEHQSTAREGHVPYTNITDASAAQTNGSVTSQNLTLLAIDTKQTADTSPQGHGRSNATVSVAQDGQQLDAIDDYPPTASKLAADECSRSVQQATDSRMLAKPAEGRSPSQLQSKLVSSSHTSHASENWASNDASSASASPISGIKSVNAGGKLALSRGDSFRTFPVSGLKSGHPRGGRASSNLSSAATSPLSGARSTK